MIEVFPYSVAMSAKAPCRSKTVKICFAILLEAKRYEIHCRAHHKCKPHCGRSYHRKEMPHQVLFCSAIISSSIYNKMNSMFLQFFTALIVRSDIYPLSFNKVPSISDANNRIMLSTPFVCIR